MNTEQYTEFLSSLGVTEDTASESQKSDATAFSTCYDWYINKQKVLPENASLAAKIWVQKYALHNSDNICLESTPEDMWDRIAKVLAEIELQTNKKTDKSYEEWKEIFYSVLKDFAYTPQGSGMFSIGNPFVNASASNCFVWDGAVHGDSLEGIFETAKNLATIYKYRGGCGTDLSHLRPANTQVNNAAKTSSGAASFMDFFSNVTSTVGQCLAEDTKILTKRGLIEIKNVVTGDYVWTEKGWAKNLETIYNGKKKVLELTTKRGFKLSATDNHTVMINKNNVNEEITVANLKINDNMVMLQGTLDNEIVNTSLTKYKEKQIFWTDELAYLIGYSYGDGWISYDATKKASRFSVCCDSKYPEIIYKLKESLKNIFGLTFSEYNKNTSCITLTANSVSLCAWLKENKILKEKTYDIKIPEVLFFSSKNIISSFISGFLDADGCVSSTGKEIIISSVAKPFIAGLQQLLMSIGIVSTIREYVPKNPDWKIKHTLHIYGKTALSLFKQVSISYKTNSKLIPLSNDSVLTCYTLNSLNCKTASNLSSFGVSSKQHILSYNKLLTLCAEFSLSKPEGILIQDKLVSIIDTNKIVDVYDLKLEHTHLFYANGFYVHNCGRRGALLESIRIDHPDIESFIDEKRDLDKQWFFDELADVGINFNDWKYSGIASRLKSNSNANVSVKLTNKFIKAVEEDKEFELWYEFENNKYPRISKFVSARKLWHKLIASATASAEPGLFKLCVLHSKARRTKSGLKLLKAASLPCNPSLRLFRLRQWLLRRRPLWPRLLLLPHRSPHRLPWLLVRTWSAARCLALC